MVRYGRIRIYPQQIPIEPRGPSEEYGFLVDYAPQTGLQRDRLTAGMARGAVEQIVSGNPDAPNLTVLLEGRRSTDWADRYLLFGRFATMLARETDSQVVQLLMAKGCTQERDDTPSRRLFEIIGVNNGAMANFAANAIDRYRKTPRGEPRHVNVAIFSAYGAAGAMAVQTANPLVPEGVAVGLVAPVTHYGDQLVDEYGKMTNLRGLYAALSNSKEPFPLNESMQQVIYALGANAFREMHISPSQPPFTYSIDDRSHYWTTVHAVRHPQPLLNTFGLRPKP